jgi:hypothetical protein
LHGIVDSQRPTVPSKTPPSALDGVGAPFPPTQQAQIIEQFTRDGYYFIGPTLSPPEVQALRVAAERRLARSPENGGVSRMFEEDHAARDLIVREPFASLAEAVLGADCHMMSQNWIVTTQEQGLARVKNAGPNGGGWHADDLIHFPLPDHIDAHRPDAMPPVFIMQVFVLLTDVESLENGPTEFVPRSHLSGRNPNDQQNPCFQVCFHANEKRVSSEGLTDVCPLGCFQGHGPVSMLGKAGDGACVLAM